VSESLVVAHVDNKKCSAQKSGRGKEWREGVAFFAIARQILQLEPGEKERGDETLFFAVASRVLMSPARFTIVVTLGPTACFPCAPPVPCATVMSTRTEVPAMHPRGVRMRARVCAPRGEVGGKGGVRDMSNCHPVHT